MRDIDDQIEDYLSRLRAEAELAERDRDELEDHLRELTHELRCVGMTAAEALTEAARRLGDPRQLAREHARVHSPFGVPLSGGRALSAALIFAVPLIASMFELAAFPSVSIRVWCEVGVFISIAIALARRVTWARAIVLGVTVQTLSLRLVVPVPTDFFQVIAEVGVLAFAMPWSRKEVSPAAITLALQIWSYGSASSALAYLFMAHDSALIGPACGPIALVSAAGGCIGTVLRARWSAIASAVSAVALFCALFVLQFEFDAGMEWKRYMFVLVGSGAVAAVIAAVLSWRTTRSRVGTLQYVMR